MFKGFHGNPLFGVGAGTENVTNLLQNRFGINQPHAHSLYFELLVGGRPYQHFVFCRRAEPAGLRFCLSYCEAVGNGGGWALPTLPPWRDFSYFPYLSFRSKRRKNCNILCCS